MEKDELLEILSNGENSGIEFKRDDILPEQLAKEIVALANFMGGMVLLGVEDDGSISGIQKENLEEWVMNVFRDKIHPTILPFYEEVSIDDKKVAIITFPQGTSKPYVVRDKGREDIYVRMGTTSCLATREQIGRLYELGGMLHTELLAVPRTDINCLDFARLENYLRDIINDPFLPSNQQEWIERLLGLGFLTQVANQTYCTIAGLVLFGKKPRRYLRQAGIRVMVFDSLDMQYQAKLDIILDGSLLARKDGGKEIIDNGLLERILESINPFISEEENALDGLRRVTKYFYSPDVIRELLLNAFSHRDWTRFEDINLVIYSDRLEILSPGKLPNSMTIFKMISGQRSARNPIIMEILRDYGYVEARGMGVRTKIIPLTNKLSGKDPEFILTDDYLKTILYR